MTLICYYYWLLLQVITTGYYYWLLLQVITTTGYHYRLLLLVALIQVMFFLAVADLHHRWHNRSPGLRLCYNYTASDWPQCSSHPSIQDMQSNLEKFTQLKYTKLGNASFI